MYLTYNHHQWEIDNTYQLCFCFCLCFFIPKRKIQGPFCLSFFGSKKSDLRRHVSEIHAECLFTHDWKNTVTTVGATKFLRDPPLSCLQKSGARAQICAEFQYNVPAILSEFFFNLNHHQRDPIFLARNKHALYIKLPLVHFSIWWGHPSLKTD